MLKQEEGSRAVAEAVALCRPEVISAYPISPQTHIVAHLSDIVRTGPLSPCEYRMAASHSRALSAATGASAPKWFADSRRVAFISGVWPDLASWDEQAKRQKERKDSKMTARTFDKAGIRYWDNWLDDRQAHVYSIGIEGGELGHGGVGVGRVGR